MAGFGTSLVNNIYPAEFGQIARNINSLQADASQIHANDRFKADRELRMIIVDGENLVTEEDRDADGHDWGPPERRRRESQPDTHSLELMAGEGALFDTWV